MVPACGVGPKSQLPSAVDAKVCTNNWYIPVVVPPSVRSDTHDVDTGNCDGASVVAAPPPGATCAVVRGRRRRGVRNVVREKRMVMEWRNVETGPASQYTRRSSDALLYPLYPYTMIFRMYRRP